MKSTNSSEDLFHSESILDDQLWDVAQMAIKQYLEISSQINPIQPPAPTPELNLICVLRPWIVNIPWDDKASDQMSCRGFHSMF